MIRNMMMYLNVLVNNKKGQGMVEYGIIIALIAAVSIIVIGTIGQDILAAFTTVEGQLP
jgi:pilus assembly protein Flp/PilA